jgi:hypothetical protein
MAVKSTIEQQNFINEVKEELKFMDIYTIFHD